MWEKRVLRVVGILAFALLGFGSAALLLRKRLCRREEKRAAVQAIEIDITTPATAAEPHELGASNLVGELAKLADDSDAVLAELSEEGNGAQTEHTREGVQGRQKALDDLTRIRGIGPKIAGILREAGITTFADLAVSEADRLRQILGDSDPRLLRLVDPTAWPEQAELVAAGQ